MAYTVLITGANRGTYGPSDVCCLLTCSKQLGIGRDLLKLYLNLPQTTAIAAVRNLAHPSVDDLRSLPFASSSRLIVVKIDSAFPEDPKDAVAVLRDQHGITQLDTVIANAGIGKDWSLIAQTDIAEVEDHFKINSVGPFALYLATRPLILASENPKFVVLSTELGSIGLQGERKIQDVAYGMSKAAVNFFIGKLHHEEPKLTAFPIHPGSVSLVMRFGGVLISLADGSKPALETPLQRPWV